MKEGLSTEPTESTEKTPTSIDMELASANGQVADRKKAQETQEAQEKTMKIFFDLLEFGRDWAEVFGKNGLYDQVQELETTGKLRPRSGPKEYTTLQRKLDFLKLLESYQEDYEMLIKMSKDDQARRDFFSEANGYQQQRWAEKQYKNAKFTREPDVHQIRYEVGNFSNINLRQEIADRVRNLVAEKRVELQNLLSP